MSEAEKRLLAQRKRQEAEEAAKLREYEEQRKRDREKVAEDLRLLKEKQERRKQEREEEERQTEERRQLEEERRKNDEASRKAKYEETKARKEEEKRKKQDKMAGMRMKSTEKARNFETPKKGDVNGKSKSEQQFKENKQKILADLKPLNIAGMDVQGLRVKVKELHQQICNLEAAKYDLEKRQERQEYDLKELYDHKRQIERHQAMKKGLVPPEEATNTKHPPKILTTSKYDRQIDRRSYSDRKDLFQNPKTPEEKEVHCGGARPPNEWGRKENDELELLRRNLEASKKYVEMVQQQGVVKPPPKPRVRLVTTEENEEDEN